MASHYWIKLYHEILDDPKMGRLSDHLWRRAVELFLIAGEMHNSGDLPPVIDMTWKLHTSEDELMDDLVALAEIGIVTLSDDHWCVVNFSKRQAAAGNTQRQQQYRDRQRMSQDNNEGITKVKPECNESVTNCNADTDTDIDIEVETKDVSTPPPKKPSRLTPDTQQSQRAFDRINVTRRARGWKATKQFPTVECKQKFDAAVETLDGEFDKALKAALEQGITSVTGVTNYVAKWASNLKPCHLKVKA